MTSNRTGSCELDLIERLAATYWRLRRIPRFEATLMAWLEHSVFYNDVYYENIERRGCASEELVDKQTAARWLGREPDQLKVLGRVLRDALTGNGVLLKLNTYEARLLRQSQQLLGQFFALRKARAADLLLDEKAGNAALDADHEAGGEGRSQH